jgi:predicted DNA binding protein
VDTKQWLTADHVTEIEVTVDDPDATLARLASGVKSVLHLEGTVARDAGTTAFATIPDPDRDVAEVAAELTGVRSARAIGDSDADLYEVCFDGQCLATTVAEHGGRVRSLTVEHGRADLRVELPPTARVREFVDRLDRFGDTRLRTRHTQTRPDQGEGGFRAALRDHLSERQDQMLRTAYFSGFFEWPRTTTGEEIAETFDVSQPTVNRHLRVGMRKCLELVYDG